MNNAELGNEEQKIGIPVLWWVVLISNCYFALWDRAAFCQIFDSIFSSFPPSLLLDAERYYRETSLLKEINTDVLRRIVDVPMNRVKFNVNTEYAYLQNFKVLQSKAIQRLIFLFQALLGKKLY